MKKTPLVLLVCALGWSAAEENVTPVLAETPAPVPRPVAPDEPAPATTEPWIGISVRKADSDLLAHLVGVPKGVGFTVREVEPAGPAAVGGLRPYDFLWKMDDQLLINEGQFIALLSLHKVGDRVRLTYQRRGKDHEAEVVLMARPSGMNGQSEVERIVSMPPLPGGATTEISVQERFAVHEGAAGVVKVKRGAENFYWVAWDTDGKKIDGGRLGLPDDRGRIEFPAGTDPVLKNKLSALIRAYEHAAGRGAGMARVPRVRRVPTPWDEPGPGRE